MLNHCKSFLNITNGTQKAIRITKWAKVNNDCNRSNSDYIGYENAMLFSDLLSPSSFSTKISSLANKNITKNI